MPAKVSVILPVYNTQEYLGQCLDSLLLQTLEDIEIICIDDASTDDSLMTLQGYSFLDSRLKIIHLEKNAGPATARNQGIKIANGKYMIFLDSDDFFEANMLEKMVAKAEADRSDVVVAGYYMFDNNFKHVSQEIKIEEKFLRQIPLYSE